MQVADKKLVKIDGQFFYTVIIAYSNKSVKRIYNTKGELVDSVPLKNFVK